MTTEGNDDFGSRLVQAREKRSLSQAELAKLAGLQAAAIGHFERDRRKPSFANVRALAKALNVSSDFLLGRSSTMEGATTAFRGEEQLSHHDREHIQMMIDLMTKKRESGAG
ncbi:helix-turn-helix transcriptional regulator [Sphingomonas sp. LY54]|uniref:helix-turn-helix domain-containing protein n=1 Tax=Sphingomonas sp. LY54 TaxID=3095343 RepID=UPI002D795EFA|nr:helix-turn-helix transcriptional regulator [Sphingomonas sp. LY54]WRP28732.1 helix-turn-helix transcriptional regulator [Sphingomonas sp. LY54]